MTGVDTKDGDVLVNANGDVGTLKNGNLIDVEGNDLALKIKNVAGESVDPVAGAKVSRLASIFKYKPRNKSVSTYMALIPHETEDRVNRNLCFSLHEAITNFNK